MILVVDNGLFAYTIKQILQELNKECIIVRSQELNIDVIDNYQITAIIVTNGIDKKDNINNCVKLIQRYAWRVPIFGIGIGAIAIGVLFGAKVCDTKITNISTFPIITDERTIFNNINKELFSTKWCRYALSDELFANTDLEVSARGLKEIVAFRHKNLAIEGVLFDATSITNCINKKIFANFIKYYLK